MTHPWLVLAVVGCILLAGCSLPGGSQTDGGTGDGGQGDGGFAYPRGWAADGLSNSTLAVRGADGAIAGVDFAERLVVVEPGTVEGETRYLVYVLVVRVDRDRERLLNQRQYYLVSNETARDVAASGIDVLGDRPPDEVQQTYLNATGNVRYRSADDRIATSEFSESTTFHTATNQRLPAVLVSTMPMLESGDLTESTTTGANATYEVEGVTADPFEDGSGQVTVEGDGLVSEYAIAESGAGGPTAYRYVLERGDQAVDAPPWARSDE